MGTFAQRVGISGLEFNKLPVLGLLALVFWFTSLSTYFISIDQEFAAFQAGPLWWVEQGRWTTHLLTRYILPQPVVPYFPHLILCAAISLSYLMLLRAHERRCDGKALLLFPLFLAFPTWYFIGEFYANLLSVAVGLVLCCLAVLMFSRSVRAYAAGDLSITALVGALIGGGLLLGAALGTYQSYITAFLGMALGVVLLERYQIASPELSRNRAPAHAAPTPGHAASSAPQAPAGIGLQLAALTGILATAVVFYQAVSLAFRALLETQEAYVGSFMNVSTLVAQPLTVLRSILEESLLFYGGNSRLFGVSVAACGAVVLLGLAAVLWRRRPVANFAICLALCVACLAAPFALHLVAGGGWHMPYRAMVAAPYAIWLMGVLALGASAALIRKAAFAALVVAAFQLLNAHASYTGARQLALAHDRDLAAAVYARVVEQFPDFDRNGSQKVDFHGAKPFASVLPRPHSSIAGFSFFEWDGGNPVRIIYFMKLIGYGGLDLITSAQRDALVFHYADMPIWPAAGAVRRVGDTVLVKLGHTQGLRYESHFRLVD